MSTTDLRPWTSPPDVRKQSVALEITAPAGTAPGQGGMKPSHSVCSVLYRSVFETGFLNEVWTETLLR